MTEKRYKLYIKTNGCQMNEYDSSKMAEVLFESHGIIKTDLIEEADIILLNTCSVREKAQEKVFSQLGQWRRYKAKNPHLIIGVGGCVASQEGSEIIKRAPFVDLVFGPQTLHRLPSMLNERLEKKKAVVDISFPEIEKFDHLPAPRAEGPTAFVSIMEGCSKYCSFCVVPYTRGEEISRPFDDVLAECYQLATQGVREINLLGQNVNDYRGTMEQGDNADLALLIHYIAAIEGIGRIRFTTSHPLAFSENLINAYAEIPELANHLHLPVQSGSDRILGLMKRGYTALEFKSKIRKLRKVRPDIRLSTDIIVGFPGETDEDFQATMDLVHDIGFDTSFSFIYSPRPGTPAANLPDDTPLEIKKQRLQILQNRLLLQASRYSQSMIGSTQRILVTGHAKKNSEQLSGRTECNRVVNFDGPTHLIGQFANIHITDALPNSLRGRLIELEAETS
jgi:tRNA-2-methylthio-N6-dimethylallyladenosine synthase